MEDPRAKRAKEAAHRRAEKRCAEEQKARFESVIQTRLRCRPKIPTFFDADNDSILQKKVPKFFRPLPDLSSSHVRRPFDPVAEGLKALWIAHHQWIRPLKDWNPKGRSSETLLRDLVKHLMVKYPVPDFLVGSFLEEDATSREKGIILFKHLTQGGSLRSVVGTEVLPARLTQKQCHLFLQCTIEHDIISAARWAFFQTHSRDRVLFETLLSTRLRTFSSPAQEEFVAPLIQWVTQQPMLERSKVGPIIDWAMTQHAGNHFFSMKGRTGVSVLPQVEQWHQFLAKAKSAPRAFNPSNLVPMEGVRDNEGWEEKWTITEILNTKDLATEGREMHHCVASYASFIENGRSSIWSFQVEKSRVLTIEVYLPTSAIVQVRGKYNKPASASDLACVNRWANKNRLKLKQHL